MINRAELKAKAKGQIKGNIGILFVIELIAGLILTPFIVMLALGMNIEIHPVTLELVGFSFGALYWIGLVGIILLAVGFWMSHYLIYLKLARGERPEIGDLFKGFKWFGKALWLDLITAFFIFLWFGIPYGVGIGLFVGGGVLAAGGSAALGVILMILGIILLIASFVMLIIKALSYAQAFYILADNPDGVASFAAFKESKRMMKGRKGELFVLELSFIGWALLGIVTLFIGFIWIGPYMYATMTNYYLAIKGGNAPVAAPAPAAVEETVVESTEE